MFQKTCTLALFTLFLSPALAQEVFMATSEDIKEFDKILEKVPLPPDLARQQKLEEEKSKKKPPRGNRIQFEQALDGREDQLARPPRETAYPVPPGPQPPGSVNGLPGQLPPPLKPPKKQPPPPSP